MTGVGTGCVAEDTAVLSRLTSDPTNTRPAFSAARATSRGVNNTNSITLAGGESLDVILDATNTTLYPSGSIFYLYTPNLDHLSNDAENFGGLMTEIHIN